MSYAQIFSTTSVGERESYNMAMQPATTAFRSTSVYAPATTYKVDSRVSYGAPIRTASGRFATVASDLQGGVLTDDSGGNNNTDTQNNTPIIPGVPDTPLDFGWDVVLLLAFLSIGYAIYIRRRKCLELTKQ